MSLRRAQVPGDERPRKTVAASLVLSMPLVVLLPAQATASPWSSPAGAPTLKASDDGNQTNETDPMLRIGTLVRIETNWGDMVLGMYDDGAPITVSNFLNLTREGFYNGIKFHRIVDGFVIQTGDPNTRDSNPYNDGWGGSSETIPLEVSTNLTHIDGAVGMARSSEPDSASSQFYICDGPQHGLDGNYAVFAVVVEGMDTVRKISGAEVYGYKRPALKEHPVEDIIMTSVSLTLLMDNGTGEDDNGTQPLLPTGGSVGMGFILLAGIAVIGLVLVIMVFRRLVRRRKAKAAEEGEDALEAEVLDEDQGSMEWGDAEGPDVDQGEGKGNWYEA